jgi:hypothetical protein
MNNTFNDMVKDQSYCNGYKFLGLIVHALNMNMDDYGDKEEYTPEQLEQIPPQKRRERRSVGTFAEQNTNE